MKKIVAITILILTFIIFYILQANIFSWFTIAGVMPNIFVILALFVGLYSGVKMGTLYGIVIGLFIDIVIGTNLGPATVMYGIIGFLGGQFDKNFSKDSRMTIMLMVLGSTILYEIGAYIFQIAIYGIEIEILNFAKTLLIEAVYNVILTIIIYPIIQNAGYYVEDIFKGQKALTRYF